MAKYDNVRSGGAGPDEQYKRTTARLQQIQTQVANTPPGNKLQGKVCIITGVGSLKGIGCVRQRSGPLSED